MDSTTVFPLDTIVSLDDHSHLELDNIPAAPEPAEQKPQPKPGKAKTTKTKPPKAPPLPATVQVHGYEVTIPNTKICWRVTFLHSCGHPVLEIPQVRCPGGDEPLVAEVNRHMRPCTDKCKIEEMNHPVEGVCDTCRQAQYKDMVETFTFWPEENVDDLGVMWGALPEI